MRRARILACLAASAGVILLVPVLRRPPGTSYDAVDPRLTVLEVCASLALVLVAVAGRAELGAVLVAVAGGIWMVPEAAGATGVPLDVRTAVDALPPVITALLVTALSLRAGDTTRFRVPVSMAMTGAAVACVARLVLVDPFDETSCWHTCEHNPFLLVESSVGGSVELAGLVLLTVGVVWAGASALPRPSRERSATAAVDAAGWVAVAAQVAWLLVTSGEVALHAADGRSVALFVLAQVAAIAWPGFVASRLWHRWQLESRLSHLLDVLADTSDPDMLATSLRTTLGDDGLRVAYWAPARQECVDAVGRTTTLAVPAPGERATTVSRHEHRIATIVHARRIEGQQIERALRPAMRLALENAQLRAAALAELAELTRSRARVVERAELERRRLERNLHDGAQQRVVSLALLVRLLAQHASPADQRSCRRAEVLTRTLVEELRRVARGIYPAVLADAGLLGGVEDLVERSDDLPIALGDFPAGRYPGAVETTAYLVVRAAIEDARSRGAGMVTVTGSDADGALAVTVEDDSAPPRDELPLELADQVRALGGTLVLSGGQGPRRVQVVLPCES